MADKRKRGSIFRQGRAPGVGDIPSRKRFAQLRKRKEDPKVTALRTLSKMPRDEAIRLVREGDLFGRLGLSRPGKKGVTHFRRQARFIAGETNLEEMNLNQFISDFKHRQMLSSTKPLTPTQKEQRTLLAGILEALDIISIHKEGHKRNIRILDRERFEELRRTGRVE